MTELTNNENNDKKVYESIEEIIDSIEPSTKDVMFQMQNESTRIIDSLSAKIDDAKENIKINSTQSMIENEHEIGQNNDMKNNDCEKCKEIINNLSSDIQKLSSKHDILDGKIANTNKILTILGTVIGLILTVIIFSINIQYSSMKNSVDSKFETLSTKIDAINQRLDYQEKLNAIQIQRDVANEVKNQRLGK